MCMCVCVCVCLRVYNVREKEDYFSDISSQTLENEMFCNENVISLPSFCKLLDPTLSHTPNSLLTISFLSTSPLSVSPNKQGSEGFEEFLQFIGERISLKNWTGFRGGLDVSSESTGTESVHCQWKDVEVCFVHFCKFVERWVGRKRFENNNFDIF